MNTNRRASFGWLAIIALILTTSLPAAAAPRQSDSAEELLRLLRRSGVELANASEALELAQSAGIGVSDAIKVLRSDSAFADTLVPLIIEETVVASSVPGSTNGSASSGTESLLFATSSTTCGWAITDLSLKGGASGLTVAKSYLRTDWCWNSAKTQIVGTPSNNPPTGSITAYGTSLGYTWTTSPAIVTREWLQTSVKYRIASQGTLKICPFWTGVACYGTTQPWIQHDMTKSGTVTKTNGY